DWRGWILVAIHPSVLVQVDPIAVIDALRLWSTEEHKGYKNANPQTNAAFQNANLMPNWISRMASASLMVPNAVEVKVVFGPLRLTILNAFVASARNCISSRSPNLKLRIKPRSTVFNPGLSRMLRPAVPGCPAAFCLNIAVLNHAATSSARDRFEL